MRNFIVLIIGFVFMSCNPKFYTPNTQNVPLISEKGETDLTISGNGNQVEFQGAYGITNHFAVKLNGGLFIPTDGTNGNGGSGKFAEVAGGYFKPIGDNWFFKRMDLLVMVVLRITSHLLYRLIQLPKEIFPSIL